MLSNRKVLVTGGAGFIGSQLVQTLTEQGANVLAIDNCFSGSPSLVPDDAQFEEVDIRDEQLHDIVAEFQPDAIVHLVALHYIPYCNANPEEAFEVNVMGTRNLLDAARELDSLETMVFTSSAAVYPPREGPNSERSETGPTDIYGETKLVGEDLMRLFQQETGVPTVTARLFNVYGPNETNEHLIPAVLTQVRSGDREIELGNLTPKRDFIHVSDVVDALLTLLTEFEDGYAAYNVGTGTEWSVREVVEKTSAALGEEIDIVQADDRVRESDRPHLQADISRMQSDFGWEPDVEFVAGLKALLQQDEEVLVT
ncbi:NAD-dependent epimerase/dehydratase family protein [Halorientalis marina]|uniref:NAD-dependent epimerase/dehydratase family protein n=1 Tax=Halorientalis marina TaxID=2931976 RepID=UPI001FF4864B|nr:NAD-dependent epimerase/dehydratase family protein [Halorientalis marina]